MMLERAVEQTFCKLQQPSLEQLSEALLSLNGLLYEVPAHKTEPRQLPYGRNVLYSTQHLEVIIIHIPPSAATAIHNHGTSIGAACLVQGNIVNSTFVLDKDGYPIVENDVFIKAGDCFTAPQNQIHQLSNPFHEPAVSIHVYSPPLRDVHRYLPYTEVLDYVI
ncbi:cysteine dioxygenase [Paenibacillus planticolens]|uniref:Cysteine dioxygenase n=1 Tax=Paenibacillus planticolens TaxID=2654976 RepID=A0ABX1ZJK6_9BACL|nr:cysteine dioxygenase family protein [Paenibacillus planticolens]NOU99147.1 cysteine dioxygenase [Paenibacillus planticolens]